ncbi:hypothetical protein AUR04nite_00140 [Glutamicibacter uratoxydans]|uniref:Uncharacterized protein n=1 Tax=Glutamicibacter uratoxydans TaxID=43667 RepID=A0A4Y4DGY0_GLUUR|nr:hypothetical protein [Glutamicibacter uratoxydans]GED04482.1 hypothetical protein AUR04nite_00140 [Glutamicibacter uratoxydans]
MTVSIHPKDLAEVFDNVQALCLDKQAVFNEVVKICWGSKRLTVYGRGRYTASKENREVLIEPSNSEGFFHAHIQDVKDVASVLKKVEGAGRAGTVVTMQLINGELVIRSGAEDLAVLTDADPQRLTESTDDEVGLWEEIDDVLQRTPTPVPAIAFTRDLIARVTKCRAGKPNQAQDVFDFAQLGGNTIGVKFGAHLTMLLEAIERKGYESGGKYSDGPGEPGALF